MTRRPPRERGSDRAVRPGSLAAWLPFPPAEEAVDALRDRPRPRGDSPANEESAVRIAKAAMEKAPHHRTLTEYPDGH